MDVALATVQSTLGEPDECGVTERRMREVLWDTYFDASSAVTQLLEEKQRNEAQARKRAGTYPCQNVMAQCVGLTARRHHGPRDRHTSEGTVASGRYGTCTHVGAAPTECTEAWCDRRCPEQGPPKAASLSRAQKSAGHSGYSAAAHLPCPKARGRHGTAERPVTHTATTRAARRGAFQNTLGRPHRHPLSSHGMPCATFSLWPTCTVAPIKAACICVQRACEAKRGGRGTLACCVQ